MTEPETNPVIEQLVAELEPVRPMRLREGLAAVLLVAGGVFVVALWLFGFRTTDMAMAADPVFLMGTGVFLLLGLVTSASVVAMGHPRVGADHSGWVWAVAIAAVVPLAGAIAAYDRGAIMPDEASLAHGFECVVMGNVFGAAVLASLVWWLRRGAPTSPERCGLLAGIAAGSLGVCAFSFACADNDMVHIGIWHSLAVALAALIGRIAVPRLVRW